MNHQQRINELLKIAELTDRVGSGKLAASIWHRNDLIALGRNQLKSHPLQKRFASNKEKIFLHAETDAISKAVKSEMIIGSWMYVARVKKSGNKTVAGMAKSCDGCLSAAVHFGLHGICYTTDTAELGFIEL